MGIVLNWSTGYNGTPASVDDTVTNFPTVTDGIHDVMASHVNALAAAVIQLETIQSTLSPIAVQDEGVPLTSGATSFNFTGAGITATNLGTVVTVNVPGFSGSTSRIEDGDGDTFVDTDLAGGDSDIVTLTAPSGVEVDAATFTGTQSIFSILGSAEFRLRSGNGLPAADDTNGSDISIVANDGGPQNVSAGGNGGSVLVNAGGAGSGASAGIAGDCTISAGRGADATVGFPGSAGGTTFVLGGAGGDGTGSAPPGFGGPVVVRGGAGGTVLSAGAPDGGDVNIQGGQGRGFSGFGGDVTLDGGDSTGTYGDVQIGGLETTNNITLNAQLDITFQANGNVAPIPFNDGVDTDLVGFTSTSIVGALNELKASPGISDHGLLSGLTDDDHTQYLLVNGTRNMSGRLVLIDGTAATPAIAFASNTNTGFYRSAANTIGISLAGTQRGSITASLVSFDGSIQSASNSSFRGTNGGSGSPTFTFTSDTDTGMYQYTSDVVGIACGGNASYRLADGTLTFNSNQLLTTTGTLSLTSTGAMALDAGAADITFDARSMSTPITLNQSGNTDLVGFTATSIVGALNELKSGSLDRVTLNAATTITAGDVVIVNSSGTVDLADADNGDQFVAGIALTSNTIGNPVVVLLSGLVNGLSGLTAGTRYYLSTTAGAMTSTAPVGSGDLVIELGFAVSATQFVLRIQEGVVIP